MASLFSTSYQPPFPKTQKLKPKQTGPKYHNEILISMERLDIKFRVPV
jgi:hypothetical protein